jgi:hypothetical protein
LSKFVNSLSISDMDSVRTQLGLLSMISSQTDEISRAFAVNQINFKANLSLFLKIFKLKGCNNESMHSIESVSFGIFKF